MACQVVTRPILLPAKSAFPLSMAISRFLLLAKIGFSAVRGGQPIVAHISISRRCPIFCSLAKMKNFPGSGFADMVLIRASVFLTPGRLTTVQNF
jgi:hypothetical protein